MFHQYVSLLFMIVFAEHLFCEMNTNMKMKIRENNAK